ncbi:hypothetical protein BROUX41_006564 [Berkeleyomyces rouxiae]|uniref:uncharacterized protein n=1 Tax=Berkeleyomyces rouxiae TaxID=2035830 RepID=UPI003B8168AE
MTHSSSDAPEPEALHSSVRHRNLKQLPDDSSAADDISQQSSFPPGTHNPGFSLQSDLLNLQTVLPWASTCLSSSSPPRTPAASHIATRTSALVLVSSVVSPVSVAMYLLAHAKKMSDSEADWPLSFVALTETDKKLRRVILDRYAHYTVLATVLVVVGFGLFRLVLSIAWRAQDRLDGKFPVASGHGEGYHLLDGSSTTKTRRGKLTGWRLMLSKAQWWLGGDAVVYDCNWGQRDLWVTGTLWTILLAFLSVYETQGDYLHFTKRLGVVAVGQMPLQYILTLKYLNPVSFVLGTSHEELNRWHRLLGRIVYSWMALHAIFYTNFFYWAGTLTTKPFVFVVLMGEVAFLAMCALASSSILKIRRRSYRLFFLLHVIGSMVVPPLIFLHAEHTSPVRAYCVVSISVLVLDIVVRRIYTIKAQCTITSVSGNSLAKIVAKTPTRVRHFSQAPASHVYLSIPTAARSSEASIISATHLQYESIFSPFTVTAADTGSSEITLITRIMNGPMTQRLAELASTPQVQVPLCFDGPHGAAPKHLKRLVEPDIDRVLLVAGGVGASFTVPVYRAILASKPDAKINFVWVVRDVCETAWAVRGSQPLIDDTKVSIFVTGDNSLGALPADERAPLVNASFDSLPGNVLQRNGDGLVSHRVPIHTRARPNLVKIVDAFFKSGGHGKVAIWVCGPEEMAKDLRTCVTPWVMDGRRVEWHNEGFGW